MKTKYEMRFRRPPTGRLLAVGEVHEQDGQRFVIEAVETHVREDGTLSAAATWAAPCFTCGRAFRFKRSAYGFPKSLFRRCEKHRNAKLTVRKEAADKAAAKPKTAAHLRREQAKAMQVNFELRRLERQAKQQAAAEATARQRAEQEAAESRRAAEIRERIADYRRARRSDPGVFG